MRRLFVTIACLAALGCGKSEKPTAAEAPQPAAPTREQPRITSPANGDVIPATAALGDTRGAKITVKGTAQPTTKVIVGSGCPQAVCTATTVTDNEGRFRAAVSASTTEANHAVTITVAYEVTDQVDSDRVIVTLGKEKGGGGGDALPTATPRAAGRPKPHHRPRSTATPFPAITVAPPAPTPIPQGTAVPTVSGSGRAGSVVVIGDSLAQGMQPYIGGALPGWKVSVNARIGRPLAEGMSIFNSTQVQPGTVYAFSLFTNDDPRSVAALDAAVRQSANRGGCVVWATIVRPAVGGVSYAAANRRLEQLKASLGRRLQLVDWAGAVAAHPDWVPGSDGVHASATGYRNRALLYAQAVANC